MTVLLHDLKCRNRARSISRNTVNHTLPAIAHDMKLLLEGPQCMPAGFPVGLKLWHHVLLPNKICNICITFNTVSLHLQMFQ